MSDIQDPPEAKSQLAEKRFGRIQDAMNSSANDASWGILLALDTLYHRGDKDRKNIQDIATTLVQELVAHREQKPTKTAVLLRLQERATNAARSALSHDHAKVHELKAYIEPKGTHISNFLQSMRTRLSELIKETTRHYSDVTDKLLLLIQRDTKALYLECLGDFLLNVSMIMLLIMLTITTSMLLIERHSWISSTDQLTRNAVLQEHAVDQSNFFSRLSPQRQAHFLRQNTHMPQWRKLHFP